MKKSVILLVLAFCLTGLFPLVGSTYDNNEFQRKSRAYSELATTSYDAGDYDAALKYAKEAEDNALLSAEFIEKAIARADTETLLFKAHTRLSWARGIQAEKYFPVAFEEASGALADGDSLFANEDFPGAREKAQMALDALAVIREITPLPAFYFVELWESSRDCFWNIAANPAVYGSALEWDRLYKANKSTLKQPSNPNLLKPGMVMIIPSIQGEYREGTYDPSIKYDSLKSQLKK